MASARSYASVIVWHKDEASTRAATACGSAQFKDLVLLTGVTIKVPRGRILYTYPLITTIATTKKSTTYPPRTTTTTLDPYRCRSQISIWSLTPSSDFNTIPSGSVKLTGRWTRGANTPVVALCRWWYVSTAVLLDVRCAEAWTARALEVNHLVYGRGVNMAACERQPTVRLPGCQAAAEHVRMCALLEAPCG